MAITGGTCAYDAQNRLIRATSGTNTVSFAYDGLNRAVTRTVNGAATHLIYDRDWNIIEEYDNAGTQIAAMAYGAATDEAIFRWASGYILSYYHQDVLGNVTTLTDTSGVPVESYRYDVYGKPTIYDPYLAVRSASFFGNSYMFTGREYFPEVGLYLYRNRAYSPELGRFLQMDPIRFEAGDSNLYRYVSNNPINLWDPLGLAGVLIYDGADYHPNWIGVADGADFQRMADVMKHSINASDLETAIGDLTKLRNSGVEINELYLLDHGTSGMQFLGDLPIGANSPKMKKLGELVSSGGIIHLLGCSVAYGKEGEEYIQALANTTGRNVTGYTGEARIGSGKPLNGVPTEWGKYYNSGTMIFRGPKR